MSLMFVKYLASDLLEIQYKLNSPEQKQKVIPTKEADLKTFKDALSIETSVRLSADGAYLSGRDIDKLSLKYYDAKIRYNLCAVSGFGAVLVTPEVDITIKSFNPKPGKLCAVIDGASAELACVLEEEFDDGNFLKGRGRALDNTYQPSFGSCEQSTGRGTYIYLLRDIKWTLIPPERF